MSPSYVYKLHESKRRRHMVALLGHRQRVWGFNDKLAGYELAASLGLQVPHIHHRSITIDQLVWDDLPDRFVIKPHKGSNSRAIFLLVREDVESYRDLMTGARKTVDQIVSEYGAFLEEGKISAELTVEELLEPRPELASVVDIPDDLKIYCFYDQPTVVMQRRTFGDPVRSNWRFRIWTSDWRDLGPVKYADRNDPTLPPPSGGDDVLAAAAVLGRQLALPFVRLDFYDTARGAVFGEVSPHPGPPELWDPQIDELLGRAWELAEARLLADRIFPSEPLPSPDAPAGPVPDPAPLPPRPDRTRTHGSHGDGARRAGGDLPGADGLDR
jgi:hypothetical protein